MVLAKNIETSRWNSALEKLLANGWQMTYQYDGIDAGIDYNCYTIERAGEKITFEWTNWEEGEILCTPAVLKEIETMLNHRFTDVRSVADAAPGTPRLRK